MLKGATGPPSRPALSGWLSHPPVLSFFLGVTLAGLQPALNVMYLIRTAEPVPPGCQQGHL